MYYTYYYLNFVIIVNTWDMNLPSFHNPTVLDHGEPLYDYRLPGASFDKVPVRDGTC